MNETSINHEWSGEVLINFNVDNVVNCVLGFGVLHLEMVLIISFNSGVIKNKRSLGCIHFEQNDS